MSEKTRDELLQKLMGVVLEHISKAPPEAHEEAITEAVACAKAAAIGLHAFTCSETFCPNESSNRIASGMLTELQDSLAMAFGKRELAN